jgi:GTP-binding protein
LVATRIVGIILIMIEMASHFLCFLISYSIGIHQRPGDLEVNICKTKALNNIRSATKEMKTGVVPPVDMSLDSCVEYLATDELLEVTPSLYRMCKNPAMGGKGKKK